MSLSACSHRLHVPTLPKSLRIFRGVLRSKVRLSNREMALLLVQCMAHVGRNTSLVANAKAGE